MEVHVSLVGRGDITFRIYRQLRDAILDGRLRPGERLPPTRELARRLDVARNTVSVAYDRLAAEGFLVARVGAGTFVRSEQFPDRQPRRARAGGVRPRPLWDVAAPITTTVPQPVYDFRAGVPDAALFPLATWRRLVAAGLRASTIPRGYGDPAGHIGLRQAIARHIGISRSVHTHADDVIVTQGVQQALDLIGRVMIEPGDHVAVEEPGYPPARLLFHGLGARIATVPVDEQGIDVSRLPTDARLVYVTPSHQFPLGTPMSLARRTALLEWVTNRDAIIVEDDYDTEFRFSQRPLEPLQSLDRTGKVVYLGTFSKTLLPMLRLGFMIAPASLQPALLAAKQLTDWHGDHTSQAALARLIDSGELSRHIRKATRVYGDRRETILTALPNHLADWLDLVPSAAGLHLCTRLKPETPVNLTAVLDGARRLGVAVGNLAGYCAGEQPQAGLILGYGVIPTDHIADGLKLLSRCFAA